MNASAGDAVLEVKVISGGRGPRKEHEHDEHMAAFVLGGATRSLAGGRWIEAKAGQLVLIAAGVPHECRPQDPDSWRYTLFLIEPGTSRALDGAFETAGSRAIVLDAEGSTLAAMAATGAAAPQRGVIAAIEEAIGSEQTPAADPLGNRGSAGPDPRLAEVEARLRGALERNASLGELAQQAKMDKYELVRAFKASYGLSPHAYLLNLRTNRAKELLRRGSRPAEAAFECGFCDQSHFTRVFSQRVGLSPAEYARTYKTGSRRDR